MVFIILELFHIASQDLIITTSASFYQTGLPPLCNYHCFSWISHYVHQEIHAQTKNPTRCFKSIGNIWKQIVKLKKTLNNRMSLSFWLWYGWCYTCVCACVCIRSVSHLQWNVWHMYCCNKIISDFTNKYPLLTRVLWIVKVRHKRYLTWFTLHCWSTSI